MDCQWVIVNKEKDYSNNNRSTLCKDLLQLSATAVTVVEVVAVVILPAHTTAVASVDAGLLIWLLDLMMIIIIKRECNDYGAHFDTAIDAYTASQLL